MKKKINNGIFYAVISLVAVLGIASFVYAYSLNSNVNVNEGGIYNNYEAAQDVSGDVNLGAVSGPDIFQKMFFHAGFQSGGTEQATTSTASAYTLVTGDILPETTWLAWTPNVNTTITTMATTTVAMDNLNIPKVGDVREIWLYNASTTVASSITIAAGTGVDLQKNEDTADLATAGTSMTKLTFIRKPDTDVALILDQFDVAD